MFSGAILEAVATLRLRFGVLRKAQPGQHLTFVWLGMSSSATGCNEDFQPLAASSTVPRHKLPNKDVVEVTFPGRRGSPRRRNRILEYEGTPTCQAGVFNVVAAVDCGPGTIFLFMRLQVRCCCEHSSVLMLKPIGFRFASCQLVTP